jgi:hypothetical protein
MLTALTSLLNLWTISKITAVKSFHFRIPFSSMCVCVCVYVCMYVSVYYIIADLIQNRNESNSPS